VDWETHGSIKLGVNRVINEEETSVPEFRYTVWREEVFNK
jgi:hypothetical protein